MIIKILLKCTQKHTSIKNIRVFLYHPYNINTHIHLLFDKPIMTDINKLVSVSINKAVSGTHYVREKKALHTMLLYLENKL